MGIGILQPSNASPYEVTGTKLFDPPVNDSTGVAALKRHPKYPDIILQPQPSEDINDPLNWLRWKKEVRVYSILGCLHLFSICLRPFSFSFCL